MVGFTDRFKCLEYKKSSLKRNDDSEDLKILNLYIATVSHYNGFLRFGYQYRDMNVTLERPRQLFNIVHIKPEPKQRVTRNYTPSL
jgi:hypothetical protein